MCEIDDDETVINILKRKYSQQQCIKRYKNSILNHVLGKVYFLTIHNSKQSNTKATFS